MTAADLVLGNATLPNGSRADVRIREGRIAAIAAEPFTPDGAGGERLELGGALLLPGFVDGHIHLDKSLLGVPWQSHRPADSIRGRVAMEKALRRDLGSSVAERALLLARQVAVLAP